ncbi:glycosyltransferase family 4 protein [Clostridium perfringens]|uniref:Glycosyltransferase n=1 Tax=Clostridium perfringens TaxID=1502 RepID=A0AAE8K6E8_CLOPF|nr:glycosyltransferase family 4 protein [Clostridium perfringens]EHK2306074.1 glycosyltransferase family 4 protein [Clostridium perfringens]MCX0415796.1 glycosyltransferase family 4 protein [Clostridium perfringens]MDK2999951.1 glycosyltransferase family 4 protein [Clostridium perfringens]MDM0789082.1 glycosyltransferase family 4 protein [Clostridium perfringens]MDM0838777.1 glycosyltransferase family 4 protein [Clostridium perfringens]
MKILLMNTFYYPNMVGGTEQSVKLLAEGLKKDGNKVYVITGDSNANKTIREEINGINIIRLNVKDRFNSKIGKVIRKALEFKNLYIKKELEDLLDEINPDVVHTNNLFYLSNIIWKLANEKGIKVVHTLRDYWGVCPKCTLLNHNSKICSKRKLLCNIHNKIYKNNSKYVNIVTAPSKFTIDLYNKDGIYTNILNKTIYNAIDVDFEQNKQLVDLKLKRENKIIKFLFLGTLDIHKGIKFMIETFKGINNKNIELNICGDGPLKDYVIQQVKLDGRIKYWGKIGGEEKEKILQDSDVMIVPSIWYEPFGRVIIEGYKYAMPVIACKIGGINELLNDEVSIGIQANSKEELIEAFEKLSNRRTIKNYLINSSKFISQYTIEEQINIFSNIYKS